MRLRSKLFIGFGFILLLMALSVTLSIFMLRDQNKSINELVFIRYERVSLTESVEAERANTARMIRDLLLDSSKVTSQEIKLIEHSRLKSNQAIEELLHIEDENQDELVTELQLINFTFGEDIKKVLDLLVAGKNEEATRIFLTPAQNQVRIDVQEKSVALQEIEHSKMHELLTQSTQTYKTTIVLMLLLLVLGLALGMAVSRWAIKGIGRSIRSLSEGITRVRTQKGQILRIENIPQNELEPIALAYNRLVDSIEQQTKQEVIYKQTLQDKALLETQVNEIIILFQGITDLTTMANLFMNKVSPIINAQLGILYLRKGESNNGYAIGAGPSFNPIASYAFDMDLLKEQSIQFGEGLVGQCAQDHQKVLISNIPQDYIKINSGLGEAPPQNILLLPIEFEGQVLAVLEFASFHNFTLFDQKLLERITRILGISLHSVAQQMQVKRLLDQSQTLTEELQVQSEELQLQHEELRSTNEQLEKQNRELELKTQEIEKVSQFKSEFLANMSHELRTPLNSMLILAQTFAENKEENLSLKQVEYASTIHSAGKDLLDLINDILDLSKVEYGKMNIVLSEVNLKELQKEIEGQFSPVAQQKGLSFGIEISPDLPQIFTTDKQHVLQILKNLLSNAFKFTDKGHIDLKLYQPSEESLLREGLRGASVLAVSVTDTGMGISKEMQEPIFEAFRQVDGTMSRKYGGTGLGLSISRELAHLLGGKIQVESEVGKGSTFTLYLPITVSTLLERELAVLDQIAISSETPPEDSEIRVSKPVLLEGKTILVVDDDMRNVFALTSLLESHNMNVLFAENGREAIELLSAHAEIDLILMDIMMPEMDGYETMRAIRQITEFETLPIIALTAKVMKNDRERCLEAGASDYIQKPVIAEQLLSLMRVWLYERGTKD